MKQDKEHRTKESLLKKTPYPQQDIAKLKPSKSPFNINDDWYKAIVQSAAEGFLVIDPQGQIIDVNDAFCQIHGYSRSELLSMRIQDINIHPESFGPFSSNCDQTNKVVYFDARHKRKDGHIIDVNISWKYLNIGPGLFFYFIRDTTELKQSEQRYKTIIQSMLEGFFLSDLQGSILDVNDAFCQMLGYGREELLTMTLLDFGVEFIKAPEKLRQRILEVQKVGGCSTVKQLKCKDGRIIDVPVSVKYLDINPGCFFCFHMDITEQKKICQELKELEERYRALIELGDRVREAVIMLQDTDKGTGIQTFVSDEWLRITGYSREELLGMPFFNLLHPRYRRDSIKRHNRKINGDKIPDLIEMSIIRKDGTEVPIEVTSGYTTYQGNKANVAYIRDITELKRIEKNLMQYQSNLEKLVGERTADLERANKNLENISRSKTEFIRAIIHELKTPITPIQAASEILIAELPESLLKDLAKQIHRGAQNLNRRIDELRDVAKSERGFLAINRKPLDLEQLLQDTIAYVAPEVKIKNLSLSLNILNTLPVILGDYDRICQVLLNLINNAIKFTQTGGIITIRALREKDEVVVEVRDTGCGLNKTELKHLFEPYYKPNIKNQSDGLGLGLALSKMLIELHGGKIYVDSHKHKGSTFKVTLPVGLVS